MLAIKHIDHIVLKTTDSAKMIEYYTTVFNCQVERTVESIGLTQLRAGDSLIDIIDRKPDEKNAEQSIDMDHFCLRILDFDSSKILKMLQEINVEHTEVMTRYGAEGDGPSIYIRDPEGNTVELKGGINDK